MNNEYLLSICIPTYNRCTFLRESLSRLKSQYNSLNFNIELIVSNNASCDDTELIVNEFTKKGLPIRYVKNQSNIGPDGNIVQCFRLAQGKYVWVLGDDDYLRPDALNTLLTILNQDEYGLIHLQTQTTGNNIPITYSNSEEFMNTISYWVTFISANIVNSKYVEKIDFEKYNGTYFIQVPLYITAALESKKNILISQPLLEIGADHNSNGGYNFFEVFALNYLNIWKEFVHKKDLPVQAYKKEKHTFFNNFLLNNIYKLLIKKETGNFKVESGWKILFKEYKYNLYFYISIIGLYVKKIVKK